MIAPGQTFYDAVGGEPTFRRIVGRFFAQVPQDEMLRAVYPLDDLDGAEQRLGLFLMQYWGGPTTYSDERGHPRHDQQPAMSPRARIAFASRRPSGA